MNDTLTEMRERRAALTRGDDVPDPNSNTDMRFVSKALAIHYRANGQFGKARRCDQLAEAAMRAMSPLERAAVVEIEGLSPLSGSSQFLGGGSREGEAARHETLGAFRDAFTQGVTR